MEIVVHSKKTMFQQKFQKEIVPFRQEFPTKECDVKMIQLDIRSRTKKSDSDS